MRFTKNMENGVLTVTLYGELDHHGAFEVRSGIDAAIDSEHPQKVVLRLSEVHFCDSSGLGLLMGRYRKALLAGVPLAVLDPSEAVARIMRLAGLDKLIKTERSDLNERNREYDKTRNREGA